MPQDLVRDFGFLTLGTRMRRLGESLQAHTQTIMQDHGITIPAAQYPFLAALDRDGPMTVGELAQAVGISQPGVTRTVGHLVAAGLLQTTVANGDQRRKQVSLTKEGHDLVTFSKKNVWPKVQAAVRDLCGDLEGPLLDQLTAIENGLDQRPLIQRTARNPETAE